MSLIRLLTCGNKIFSRINDFAFSIPKCVACAISIARCCKLEGITIRVPLSITLSAVEVSSFSTALNGFTTGESHLFVLIVSRSVVNVTSEFVASMISLSVNAFGTLLLVTKLTHCSVIFSCVFCLLSCVGWWER